MNPSQRLELSASAASVGVSAGGVRGPKAAMASSGRITEPSVTEEYNTAVEADGKQTTTSRANANAPPPPTRIVRGRRCAGACAAGPVGGGVTSGPASGLVGVGCRRDGSGAGVVPLGASATVGSGSGVWRVGEGSVGPFDCWQNPQTTPLTHLIGLPVHPTNIPLALFSRLLVKNPVSYSQLSSSE
eukprot:scaffold19299_cov104-Isochrysis_galbana.AAC.1